MRARFFFLAAAVTLTATPAFAQDDPRKARGEALYNEAATLHESGHEAEALAKLREAYSTYPTPNTLYSIAREEQLLGQNRDAIHDYRGALKDPLLNLKFQDLARAQIAALEKTTARIQITAPDGATVTVDGSEVDARDIVDVDVGVHVVSAAREQRSCAPQRVETTPGNSFTVTLKFTDEGGGGEPPKTEEHKVAFPPPTGAILLGGVGLVGLGLGVGFAVGSQSNSSDLDSHHCTTTRDPQCTDLNSARQRDATISVISYVAGGALLAGGIVWWFVAPRRETVNVGLSPSFGPGGGALRLHGTF